jgi:hypothetical protein
MKTYVAMHRTFFVFTLFAAVGVGGITVAYQHTAKAGIKATELSR